MTPTKNGYVEERCDVNNLLSFFIETDFPEPEVLKQLDSLVTMIQDRPHELIGLVVEAQKKALDRFFDEGYCPECGSDDLALIRADFGANFRVCNSCGYEL